ncbi:MAG: hypothetical protein ACR2NO_03410 [Chloroflexota bacterium]
MSRYAIAGLRLLASLGAGVAAWTTFWVVRGGEPGPAAYLASLAATFAVYVASTRPPPLPWERRAGTEEVSEPVPGAPN